MLDLKLSRMAATLGIRWAFNFQTWKPSREEWILAGRCIQAEEKSRIGQFYFQRDAKSAMAGRLLMRKAIAETLKIPYRLIQLARTDKGKPYLVNEQTVIPLFTFNVSHQGDLAVLAAEPVHSVGIDVMKVDYPKGNRTVDDFVDMFRKQFTEQEWDAIKENVDEWEQLQSFYRYWCLKESYVKVLGTGLGFSVSRLDFHVASELRKGLIVRDTQVYVDGKLEPDWMFEESVLDGNHCVAVAQQKRTSYPWPQTAESPQFQMLSFAELTSGVQLLSDPDELYWKNFASKAEKAGGTPARS